MLYHGENPILQIVAVEDMRWGTGTYQVEPRPYSALAFRIRGTATIECGQRTFVNTNDILYLPQNLGYTATYTDTEMIAIHFVTAHDDREMELYSLKSGEQIYKMFLRAHALWQNREPGCAMHVLSQLYAILGSICEKETKTNLPPHFLKAVSYINSNYKSNLSIKTVCEAAGIGTTVFRQLFKQYYQKTPVEYITQLRLEHARNQISGGMPIELAAAESGFSDPKYFARVVKKHLGCTPRELKKYGK